MLMVISSIRGIHYSLNIPLRVHVSKFVFAEFTGYSFKCLWLFVATEGYSIALIHFSVICNVSVMINIYSTTTKQLQLDDLFYISHLLCWPERASTFCITICLVVIVLRTFMGTRLDMSPYLYVHVGMSRKQTISHPILIRSIVKILTLPVSLCNYVILSILSDYCNGDIIIITEIMSRS